VKAHALEVLLLQQKGLFKANAMGHKLEQRADRSMVRKGQPLQTGYLELFDAAGTHLFPENSVAP
jgi:hypothetical protein